jgi:hypothetical protein
MQDDGLYRTTTLRDEDQAVAELSARIVRVRTRIAIGTVLVAVALGVVGYFVVRGYYLAKYHRFNALLGITGVAPPLVLMLPITRVLQRVVVRLRAPAWMRAIGARHRVEPERLAHVLALW